MKWMSDTPKVMQPDSRIYVTGHRGLVGSAIVRKLRKEGFANLVLVGREELDLRDQAAVDAWFAASRPEYVFHAAGTVGGILANSTRPAEFIYDNMMLHATVVHSAYRHDCKKLLYLGSSCIYPRNCPQPMKEEYLLTGPLEPTNEWYAIAKIAGIKLCQAYRRQYGFDAIAAMPTNLYGPNDNFDLESSHVLPALIRKFHLAKLARAGDFEGIADDEKRHGRIPDDVLDRLGIERNDAGGFVPTGKEPNVFLWGTGSPRREFLHVDDLADACLFLMQHYDDEDIVNIGVGEDMTLEDLSVLVQKIVGFEGKVIWDSAKPDGTPRKLLDVSRIRELGWAASIRMVDGIREVYRRYTGEFSA